MLVLLLALLSLVEVHCQQAVPYVSFRGQVLADHSYVNIGQVGMDGSGSNSVQCRTDLSTCCSERQGDHRGDWSFPNGDRLPHPGSGNIHQSRGAQRIDLRRNNANEPNGIYRCDVPTNTDNRIRVTVYVGLYTSGEGK